MYVPDHFAETRPDALRRLIASHPLGALVTQGPDGLDADHVPFAFDAAGGPDGPAGRLIAHVARANPVWRSGDRDVLVIFRGAESYVSPNWYPSKHEEHRQVPTWNYEVVHVHGRMRVHDDVRFVRGVVARLTRAHESNVGEPRPWKMTESEPAFIDGLLSAIVGIEIVIDRIVGKSKLSQNKAVRDRGGAADALQRLGRADIARAMRPDAAVDTGPAD